MATLGLGRTSIQGRVQHRFPARRNPDNTVGVGTDSEIPESGESAGNKGIVWREYLLKSRGCAMINRTIAPVSGGSHVLVVFIADVN